MKSARPAPLDANELDEFFSAIERGKSYREALEALLLGLTPEKVDRLTLLLAEGRGAWHPLTRTTAGRALWLGNAFSGSWLPLAQAGFQVTVVDPCLDRVRFADIRSTSQPTSSVEFLVAGSDKRLPFCSQSFDLVIQEEGLPGPVEVQFGHELEECLRVSRGECFVTVENRFAYKRSEGRRAEFPVPSPLKWIQGALVPKPGHASRRGQERQFRSTDFDAPVSHALYPHMRDFTHIVALDGSGPQLPIGPLERKNRLKVVGKALGLFPVLTPSFVIGAARRSLDAPRESRMERVLRELAQRLGEPIPEIENWTATRGNCAVLLTRGRGSESAGRWALHVPMNEKERQELIAHDANLRFLRQNFPEFPVPDPLFSGTIEDLWLSCERRVDGIAATQISDEPDCASRLLRETAQHLSGLVMQHARPLNQEDLERLVGTRFDRVAAKAHRPETIAHAGAAREAAFEALLGLSVPRVFYHADIRSKHVRVRRDGSVLGYLDLGCSSLDDLPYFDLLNLVVHENKRPGEFASTNAWQRILTRKGIRPREREALEHYASALSLPEAYCRAIEELYPILVVAMCELNWDYSRPRWLHEHFGY